MFSVFPINCPYTFDDMYSHTLLEDICPGRKGGVLVETGNVPEITNIVRTTTKYSNPPCLFNDRHIHIKEEIEGELKTHFNNALVEVYTEQYRKMGYHSDQALDLDDSGVIAIFSLYKNEDSPNRCLVVKNKLYKTVRRISLENKSVLFFTTEENETHFHKIIRETNVEDQEWFGMTLRLSKRFITFADNSVLLEGKQLEYKPSETGFFKLRSFENKSVGFSYPSINYTLSFSDLRYPIVYP